MVPSFSVDCAAVEEASDALDDPASAEDAEEERFSVDDRESEEETAYPAVMLSAVEL